MNYQQNYNQHKKRKLIPSIDPNSKQYFSRIYSKKGYKIYIYRKKNEILFNILYDYFFYYSLFLLFLMQWMS
jgi:hypothetical protein